METGGRGSDGHHAHHHVGAGQGGGKDVVTTLHQHMAVKIVQGREKEHKNVMRTLVQVGSSSHLRDIQTKKKTRIGNCKFEAHTNTSMRTNMIHKFCKNYLRTATKERREHLQHLFAH